MLVVVSSVFPEKWSQKRQKCRFDKHQLKIVTSYFGDLNLLTEVPDTGVQVRYKVDFDTSKRRTQNPEKVQTSGCDVFKKSHCAQIKYNIDIKNSLCSN